MSWLRHTENRPSSSCFGRFENDEIEPGTSTRDILSLLATRLKVLNLRNDFFI